MAGSETTLVANLSTVFSAICADVKGLTSKVGDLSQLTTTEKSSLVLALNSLKTAVGNNPAINDSTTTTTSLWSSKKVSDQISSAINDLINGAPGTLDTLKELADAITTNKDAIAALQTIAAGHVKYDAAQSLTDEQKKQARDNIAAAASADVGTLTSLSTTAKGSAVAAINEVNTTAKKGVSDAASAASAAKAAQSSADTAKTNAATAQSTANAAKTAAGTAQTTIDNFKTASRRCRRARRPRRARMKTRRRSCRSRLRPRNQKPHRVETAGLSYVCGHGGDAMTCDTKDFSNDE